MSILFFLFSLGLILGVVPPYLWGKNGGDEGLIVNQPHLKKLLDLIHHWHIGILLYCIGILLPEPFNVFVIGWGTTTYLDDVLFHSYESYFERKIKSP